MEIAVAQFRKKPPLWQELFIRVLGKRRHRSGAGMRQYSPLLRGHCGILAKS